MARKHIDHFESYDWLGFFWFPDADLSDKFSGRVTYNPVDGVELDVILPATGKAGHSEYLYGVLSTGVKCTIFCKFDKKHFSLISAGAAIFKAKVPCMCIVLGLHVKPDYLFQGVVAEFTNFNGYCNPVGSNDDVVFRRGAIQSAKSDDYSVVVFNKANFSSMVNIEAIFYSENSQLMGEVKDFFGAMEEKYSDDLLMKRNSLNWGVEIKPKNGLDNLGIYELLISVEELLSILVCMPVRRKVISVHVSLESGRVATIPILFSFFDVDHREVTILKTGQPSNQLPINLENENFAELCVCWLSHEHDFRLYSGMISTNFGVYSRHDAYAEIVLLLTEIEAISGTLGGGKAKLGKYTKAIEHYGDSSLVDKIIGCCGVSDIVGVGAFLSDLRAEIAHIGKSKKILNRKSTHELIRLVGYLRMVVASHILSEIGVARQNTIRYQKVFARL